MPMSSDEQEKSEALYRAVNEQLERQNQILAAQYDLAKKMAEAQGINVASINKSKTAYDGLYGSTNKQSAAAESNAQSLKVMQEASANFTKSLNSAGASLGSFAKALLSNEQGFAKYNQTLSSAGDAAMSLGKNFGLLGMAFGAVIKGATLAAEQFTKQADNTLKATDSLSKLGGAGSLTADQVLSMGHKAGLTSANLDIMTKAAAKANTGMAGLGSTVGDGIKAFGDMTAVTKEQRMAFQRMGINQEELMEKQADYVKLQELSGINLADQAKQGKNLKAASLDYAENLVRLSALTGKSADDLAKEKMLANEVYEEQIQTQMEQAKIRQLREDGYKDQADDLQRQQENRKRAAEEYVHAFGKEQGLQMARAVRTGTFDQSTAGLATIGFDPAAEKRKLEQAKTDEEVDKISAETRDVMKKRRDQMLLSAGSAVVLSGEATGKALGLGSSETAQAYGRMGTRSEVTAAEDARNKTKGLATGEAGAGGAAATDPAQIARNKLTETEIAVKVELDKLIASFNPLLKGFDAGTIAALALAAAATAAALALAKMAASAAMNKMGGGGPDVPDKKGKAKARDPKTGRFVKGASAVKDAGALSKMAGTAGKFAGPAAGVIAVGAGAMTAYQGVKDVDEKVKSGELTKDEGTVKKSEAVGTGVGQAAGGAAGAWGGAAAGAAIGSIVPVVGTVIGGLLGAAVGGWLGTKGGEIVGEKVGKSVGKAMADKPASGGSSAGSGSTVPAVASAPAVAMGNEGKRGSKPSPQSPEGSENGTGSASKTVDLGKIMKFGTGSGTQQNFESLQPTFKDAVVAAATEYNSVTGNKLTINSAKRDPEDQQRLWDESVAAGRPGKGPTGMAIGKPGRSLHEKGEAVDIQNYKDPDAVAAMNKQGLTQKVPGDPVHFQANLGGILDGPTSGYPVEGTMHGREAIIPLNPDSIITKLLTTSEAQIKQEMNNSVTTNMSTSDNTSQIMADLYTMMEEKFDAMIDALEDGNDHTEKLVKFSAV